MPAQADTHTQASLHSRTSSSWTRSQTCGVEADRRQHPFFFEMAAGASLQPPCIQWGPRPQPWPSPRPPVGPGAGHGNEVHHPAVCTDAGEACSKACGAQGSSAGRCLPSAHGQPWPGPRAPTRSLPHRTSTAGTGRTGSLLPGLQTQTTRSAAPQVQTWAPQGLVEGTPPARPQADPPGDRPALRVGGGGSRAARPMAALGA